MTHSPTPAVGPLPPAARHLENTAPHTPRVKSQRPSARRNTRRVLAALLGALTFAALRFAGTHRAPPPVMQHLTTADERRFAVLCQQITRARQGVEQ